MGHLADGKWTSQNILSNHDERGLYYKRPSVFRHHIGNAPDAEFPAEALRYHLYCAVACPWAHRTTLMRTLKKLESIVTLTNTFQEPGGQGWSFGEAGHIVPGTDLRVRWLHELYTIADPACTMRVTVPTLWDAKTRRVVNNESSEIIRMFNSEFNAITGDRTDLYPQALRAEIDADFLTARAALRDGDLRAALAAGQAPLLPRSEAPAIRAERDELVAALRHAVLDRGDVEALWEYSQREPGRDDLAVFERLAVELPVQDPRQPVAADRRAALQAE